MTPWQPDPNFDSFAYTSYLISVSAVSWTGGSDATSRLYLVDSVTISISMPDADAAAINTQFNPPARYSNDYYFMECEATPPALSFTIGGRGFFISLLDMIWYDVEGAPQTSLEIRSSETYLPSSIGEDSRCSFRREPIMMTVSERVQYSLYEINNGKKGKE
jgi:hypothetical protein